MKKSRLLKAHNTSRSVTNKNRYTAFHNKLKADLKEAEKQFYDNVFKIRYNNVLASWKLMNNKMKSNNYISNAEGNITIKNKSKTNLTPLTLPIISITTSEPLDMF